MPITPVVITDPWTGNEHTVYPSLPLTSYPKGYFGDSLAARLPFYSKAELLAYAEHHRQMAEDNALRCKDEWLRERAEKAVKGWNAFIAAIQADKGYEAARAAQGAFRNDT